MDRSETYKEKEKKEIEASAKESARIFAHDVFEDEENGDYWVLYEKITSLRMYWILSPSLICQKILNDANIPSKHINKKES